MAGGWRKVHGYPRSQNGKTVQVASYWAFYEDRSSRKLSSYRHACPKCGAKIVSVRMPNAGWAHFEGARGLGRVKHPCFTLGDGLSRRDEDMTGDLFDVTAAG